jgi:hypothetical protein
MRSASEDEMRTDSIPVEKVRTLLNRGELSDTDLDTWIPGEALGLWSRSLDSSRLVASKELAHLCGSCMNEQEAVASLFACAPELRSAWVSILAARLKEYGANRNIRELIPAIEKLGPASNAVRQLLIGAQLRDTGLRDVEIRLFGAPADQAVTYPSLLRVIAATASVIEGGSGKPVSVLPDIDPLAPQTNWTSGRLVRLPDSGEPGPGTSYAVLPGSIAELGEDEMTRDHRLRSVVGWVLMRPWFFLLAQVVFTQEAWAAERSGSQLTLELPEDQFNHAHEPWQVLVFVTLVSGEEVKCGTLGELIERIFARLSITLLVPPGTPKPLDLDARLAQVINRLLRERVWRIADFSGLQPRRGYLIDEEFSNLCYRALGNRYFSRLGSLVTAAIRSVCERWAEEALVPVRPAHATPQLGIDYEGAESAQ